MQMDLYEAMNGKDNQVRQENMRLPEHTVKSIMYQVLKAIDHAHSNKIFHRDIRPENILITGDVVKLADWGTGRSFSAKPPFTEYCGARWYRSPESLLTDGHYNFKTDIWSFGCVFYEVLTLKPLFPGDNELDQLHMIHNVVGTPPQKLLDKYQRQASHMQFNFPQ